MAPAPVVRRRAAQGLQAVPLRSLLDRIGSGVEIMPWSGFLPEALQPPLLRAQRLAAQRKASSPPLRGDTAAAAAGGRGGCFDRGRPSASSLQDECPSMVIGLDDLLLTNRVWALSQEARGCRQVQEGLEFAENNEQREAIAQELHGHVAEAARCPHANHVLQKLIVLMPAPSLQFIVDELTSGSVGQIAKHKYGCRILQRLIEFCPQPQVSSLVEAVLEDILPLTRHSYGNYVIQVVQQHGTIEQQSTITTILAQNLRVVASEVNGCAVLSTALSHGDLHTRQALARRVLQEVGLLSYLATTRHGHIATLRALEVLAGSELEQAVWSLLADSSKLRSSKYGQEILEKLEEMGRYDPTPATQACNARP